jgi:hypothetical protein
VTAVFDGTNVKLAFGIPRGENGSQGFMGATGAQGPPGEVTLADLNGAVATAIATTSSNSNAVAHLAAPYADPDAEELRQKLNELILALRR